MVDFGSAEFDLRDAADDGAWCQLLHPVKRDELGVEDDAGPVSYQDSGRGQHGVRADHRQDGSTSGPTSRGNAEQ